MRRTFAIGALAAVLLLAGCGGGGAGSGDAGSGDTGYGPGTSESATPEEGTSASDLKLAETSLGEVVVTGSGMTAYMFDNDTQGTDTSACTGACLQNWPPIIASGDAPVGDGITGELGTIETADGQMQVTLNGWPLYLFAGDSAAGDVNGQAVQDVWWVVDAAGEKIGG
ncbi:hypothetical protein MZK47_11685 [Microbacterium aerolatum]|uniref:COG4315 family predicted lipoprotein n=1 Tax=Microbacterium aerolatum TaxID=153731 RepID=UPI0020017590|nr:hypothetical protein [Microbacterium aerolatum]MCK3770332.1 hypothetical protein [Microbacterium aerolatum]